MSNQRLKNFLYGPEQIEALNLWRQGLDTKQIASQMEAEEYAVYNGLHEIREDFSKFDKLASRYGLMVARS